MGRKPKKTEEEKARERAAKASKKRAREVQALANKVKVDIYGTKRNSSKTQTGRQKEAGEITGIEEIYNYLIKAGYNKYAASHPAYSQYHKYIKDESKLDLLPYWEGTKSIGGIWQEGTRSKGARAKLTYSEYLDYMETHLQDIHDSATRNSDTGEQGKTYSSKNIGKYFINKINKDLRDLGVKDENGEPLQLKGKTIKSVFGAGSKEESEYKKLLSTVPDFGDKSAEEALGFEIPTRHRGEETNGIAFTGLLLSLYWESKRRLIEAGKGVGIESDTVVSDLDIELNSKSLIEATDTLTKRYTPSLNDVKVATGNPPGVDVIQQAEEFNKRTDLKGLPKVGAVSKIKIIKK